MRKLLCFLLCMVLFLSMTLPAFASEDPVQPLSENPDPAPTTPVVTPSAPTQCSHSWVVESSTAATCTENGTSSSLCSLCGTTKIETIPATGHSLGAITQKDESSHKRTCATCGYEDTTAHTLSENVITAATCVSTGKSTFSCPCGYTFDHEYPATGEHTWTEWSATVETHSRSCTVCQKAESGAHGFTERVELQPTCKEAGIIADYCPTCQYIVYEEIPKLTTHTYDNACDVDCNVCGLTRKTEHKHQAWWTKGTTGHWHACTVCGDKGDFEKHYPGPAATEEKDQLCLVCGYIMTPKKNHQHDYANTWTSDEEGHWYACSGCEDQKDFAGHTFDDACDPDCNICAYKTDNAHTFDGTWHSDEEGHWFVCSACGGVAEAKPHTPPENPSPDENQYCTNCGYKIAEATAHIHAFGEVWLKDSASHWQECECGETSAKAAHTWDSGREEEDRIIRSCPECGAEYAEELPAVEKNEFPWWIVLVVLLIMLVAAIVALVFVLKSGKKGKYRH